MKFGGGFPPPVSDSIKIFVLFGFTFKWDSYATVNDMGAIYGALGTLKSNMISHCATEADKKAICENVTGAEIVFGSDAAVKYSTKKISISTNEAYAGDSAYSEILDKF